MYDPRLLIADEVEAAISAHSTERCSETAKRVSALFVGSAASLNDEQIALFGEVFERLVNTIELRAMTDIGARIALAELSTQLAPVAQAPVAVIRRLAHHEEISVAGPVLTESARLTADDLVEIARTKGERHLLAISGRWWLKEVVTDALLFRRLPSVSRRLMQNPGARISAVGFTVVLAQAMSDPELAVATGVRVDLPPVLRSRLLQQATEAVRSRVLSSAPAHLFEEIRDAIAVATEGVDRELSKVRDFGAAKAFVAELKKSGALDETRLREFARARRYEETVVALAELSGSVVEVVRPLMQSLRSEGVLVPCKAAGLNWETVSAVLDSRFSTGKTGASELAKLREQFEKLATEDTQRLLRLWRVRSTPSTNLH